ncbi:hypothetical protein BEWA_024180 [Theileria equi strain WA]|uniref:Uncharacterized protein n=1 Tax=Theileria equi strain WA TaxID=1537102 RepID=L0AXD8_THEEQ|nr:hypothetical protein BEWA_024180 [Theileria equi strain WA]AFZ79569.1 hypothetical protein BEWA_024180 [Theileria equi strain WA]|eukprot:XP_004829235.1 hypothetical protein BEWA_024180 [Theileria equi strain WA]
MDLPTVTIDIQGNTNGGGQGAGSITYYGGSPNQVKLTKIEDPPGSGFVKLVHTSATGTSGGLFTVGKVQYGGTPVSDIKPDEPIKSLSVWYHSGDKNHNQPLLIEIEKKDGTYDYHETKGSSTEWNPHGNGSQDNQRLEGKALEQKLEYLNCQYHKLVTINLTFQNSSSLSEKPEGENKYCCGKHNGQEKVTVKGGKVASQIPYVKHHIDNGTEVSGIKYYDEKTRKNITSNNGIRFPIQGSLSVYAFYCGGKPVLIYLDSTSNGTAKGWYKQSPGGDTWEETLIGLKNKDPENIKDCSEKNFEQLVNALNKFPGCGYETCVGPAKSVPSSPLLGAAAPVAGSQGPTGPAGKDGAEYGNPPTEGKIDVAKAQLDSKESGLVTDKNGDREADAGLDASGGKADVVSEGGNGGKSQESAQDKKTVDQAQTVDGRSPDGALQQLTIAKPSDTPGTGKQVGKYCNDCRNCQNCECGCRSGGSEGRCIPDQCTKPDCQCCKDRGGTVPSVNAFLSQGLMIILAFTGDGYLKTYSKYEHDRSKWPTKDFGFWKSLRYWT